jgi:hypothetical protein
LDDPRGPGILGASPNAPQRSNNASLIAAHPFRTGRHQALSLPNRGTSPSRALRGRVKPRRPLPQECLPNEKVRGFKMFGKYASFRCAPLFLAVHTSLTSRNTVFGLLQPIEQAVFIFQIERLDCFVCCLCCVYSQLSPLNDISYCAYNICIPQSFQIWPHICSGEKI